MEVWLIPTAALLVGLLAIWLLKPVIDALLASAAVRNCDTTVLEWFRSRANPTLDRTFQGITLLGSPFAMTVYAFLGLSMLVKQRRWLLLFSWDVMFLGMWVLTQTIKPLFHRERPAGAEHLLTTTSFSFPSSHALSAIAAFGMITFALTETIEMERESRAALWFFTATLVICVGTSRLYLGAHYLSDVLAGLLTGALWLAVCLFAYRRARNQFQQLSKSPTA